MITMTRALTNLVMKMIEPNIANIAEITTTPEPAGPLTMFS